LVSHDDLSLLTNGLLRVGLVRPHGATQSFLEVALSTRSSSLLLGEADSCLAHARSFGPLLDSGHLSHELLLPLREGSRHASVSRVRQVPLMA